MAKRFTDTEKFNDKWYRTLSLLHKVIWEYLLAECNHAGVLEKFDIALMSFKIGTQITIDDLKSFGERIVFVSDEVLFIPKFIKFQYGDLNPQNKVHASVLRELERWGIDTPSKPLASPIQGAKDKDKDKNKDKEIGKGGMGEKPISINPDFYFSSEAQQALQTYQEKCPNLIPLTGEKKNKRIMDKLYTVLNELDHSQEKFKELCKNANDLQKIADIKIDFEMMLNCHIGIVNGKYITTTPNAPPTRVQLQEILEQIKQEEG